MDMSQHTLETLFEQLGLDSSPEAIDLFIQQHPLEDSVLLPDAPFWNEGQRSFLRESWKRDSSWSPIVDNLNTLLRDPANEAQAQPALSPL